MFVALGSHGIPRDNNTISNEIQQVMHGVGRRESNKTIKSRFALRYVCIVITRVYKEEERQKRNMTTEAIKVSGLIHRREEQSDPELIWDIFHKIYNM